MLKSIGLLIGVGAFALGVLLPMLFSGGTNVEIDSKNENDNILDVINKLNSSNVQVIIINNNVSRSD